MAMFPVLFCALHLAFLIIISRSQDTDRPNVILIISDDLGFNDVGFHGSEIETPFLDSMALGNHSVELANYYGVF